jgi:hypothetical protein
MRAPLSLGWASSKITNPFVTIVDGDGNAVAQAIGLTLEAAMEHARIIVYAVNKQQQEEQ